MEIQKTIKLKVIKSGKNIICYDLTTLQLIIGTKSVSGNLHIYGITKDKNRYIVPIEVIKKRIEWLEDRIEHFKDYIEIMRQVI